MVLAYNTGVCFSSSKSRPGKGNSLGTGATSFCKTPGPRGAGTDVASAPLTLHFPPTSFSQPVLLLVATLPVGLLSSLY